MSKTPSINNASAQELGRMLVKQRKNLGWSLEDVAARLKLPVEKIIALEQGDYSGLPEPVYIRGFLKNYARLLNLDEQEALSYLEKAAPVGQQDMSALEHGTGQRDLAYLEQRKNFPGWLAGLLALLVIGGGIYFWQTKTVSQQQADAAGSNVAAPQASAIPEGSNIKVVPMVEASAASATAASAASDTAAPAAASMTADGQPLIAADELYIKPRYRTKMVVKDKDGKELLNSLVAAGSEQRFRGGAPYDVRIGYVQGSVVNYGGKNIDYGPNMVGRTTAAFKAGE